MACTLLVVACEPSEPAQPDPSETATPPEAAQILRWALGSDPTSLDPAHIVRDDDALVVDALFDSLTRLGPDLTAEPALARNWTRNEEATVFTFALDPAARWHDGSRVLAEDVVRGLQRVADGALEPPSLHANLLRDVVGFAAAQVGGGSLPGVTAPDDTTVRIELSDPVPELPVVLAHPSLAPVPPAAVDDPREFAEAPIGNGPFLLAEPWAHNQFLRLAPSSTHPSPHGIDEVVFRIYHSDEDRAIRHADLLAGQIQVSQLPAGRRSEVLGTAGDRQPPPVELHDGMTDTASLLLFDTRRPPLDDERFRRAVSMLVDREALADRTDGARVAARSLVPPVVPGGGRGVCAWCRYDPAAARSLIEAVLEEKDPELVAAPTPIVLQTSTDALHGALADQVARDLRSLGLQVRVVRADAPNYLSMVEEEQPAIIRLGWSPEEPTLRGWTEALFAPGSTGARLTGWQPAPLRDLLANAAATADPDLRRRNWQQVERLALDAAVVAPVLFYHDDLLVADGVEGVRRDPFGNVDLAQVSIRRTDAP